MYEPEDEPNGFEVRKWKEKPSAKKPEASKPIKAKRSWRNAPAFAVFTVVIAFMVLMGVFHLSEWASENIFTVRADTSVNLK